MKPETVFFAENNAQAIEHLRHMLTPGAFVLVKGSHGMHLEEIVEELRVPV